MLEVRNVTKRYSAHLALDRVSLHVPKGQIFGLLGPNGAGKTTLIRIINRITAPDSGEVFFDGHLSRPEDVARIGYLPEERGLYKKMKVGDEALYLAQLKGLSAREARTRLQEWFERFDILSWWNRRVEELSKGMQQKLQFIITVVHRPDLLIFDEPFSGFDPVNAELLKQEILALKEQGHTIIFSTHNMASVEELCDHIALINHAQVVLSGSVRDVREQFKDNRYRVAIQQPAEEVSPINTLFQVEEQVVEGDVCRLVLQKNPSVRNAELLSALASRYEILSFEEIIPSMHEIFIRTVSSEHKPQRYA